MCGKIVHCSACGTAAEAAARRCAHCNAALPSTCPRCGAANSDQALFCGGCGTSLSQNRADEAPLTDAAKPTFDPESRRFGHPASEGERKQVTVLFADLGGSLSAIEAVDAEEAEALLDAVVAAMIEAVRRFEGTVNQTLGDGIMALFGAPIAHEDHAVRAACAALAMQASVQRLKNESWESRKLTPEIRVGLNSGEVVIRSVRNDMSVDYRAIGSTTHLAARMEQLAARGTIRLTENVMRLGRGMLRARPLGPMVIRGLSQPVKAFELTGVATSTRFQATIERGLSPLIGRDRELALFQHALEQATSGRASAVVAIGDPGIGKSRLCHELLRSAETRAYRVLAASALSYARATPHGLLVSLLKSLFEIGDDDTPEKVRGLVVAQFSLLGLAVDRANVALELLDVSNDNDAWRRLDPVQRLRSIENTVTELLRAWCASGPCVVVLEDLHWADEDSLSFVRGLLERPPGERLLLLLTQRSDLADRWPESAHLTRCRLGALSLDQSEALVHALLGNDQSLTALRRQLAERTQGNPFFIEETTRAFVDMGVL